MTEVLSVEGWIEGTRRWIEEIVVGHTLCPFARGLLEQERVGIRVAEHGDAEGLLHLLAQESSRLDELSPDQLETSLVLHPGLFEDFEAQLDFLPAIEALHENLGLDAKLQVVSFHPDYRFEGAPLEDAANYTNRSPFGMFHLLRRASVEGAVASHPDPDSIWRRNVEVLREFGSLALEARLVELRALANASS